MRNLVDKDLSSGRYIEAYGNSKEEKPIESIVSGSTFYCVDTCELFMFDELSSQWYPQKVSSVNFRFLPLSEQ